MVQWQPLHQRGDGPRYVERPDQPLHEGVPPHLREPLRDWLQLNVKTDVLASITARVQVDAGVLRQRAEQRKRSSYVLPHEILFELVGGDPAGLLDLVDLVLSEGPRFGAPQVRKIETILANAGSAWRVDTDGRSLVRRFPEPMAQTLEAAIKQARSSAGGHLAAAWQHAFTLRADASRAFSEAIKAVESAAIPVVVPHSGENPEKVTFSVLFRTLEKQRDSWRLAITTGDPGRDLGTVIGMLRLLWEGQTDRHGGVRPTQPPTLEAAQAAVQIAVLLVPWFTTGAVRKV